MQFLFVLSNQEFQQICKKMNKEQVSCGQWTQCKKLTVWQAIDKIYRSSHKINSPLFTGPMRLWWVRHKRRCHAGLQRVLWNGQKERRAANQKTIRKKYNISVLMFYMYVYCHNINIIVHHSNIPSMVRSPLLWASSLNSWHDIHITSTAKSF